MNNFKLTINNIAAITGAILIASYIIFGGSFPSRKTQNRKAKKKGTITGLVNVGNSCFLNCILQALASCPSFTKWLELKTMDSPPVLLLTLNRIITILNNKTEENIASAIDILKALRSHGWVISAEEQDAHELFHALTSTIDDEIMQMRQQSNSLLNVSWIASEKERKETRVNGCDSREEKEPSSLHGSFPDINDLLIATKYQSEPNLGDRFQQYSLERTVSSSISKIQRGTSIISKVPSSLKQSFHSITSLASFESPFKGHLASQLTCNVCGFKNVEQWSTFESISLSLPNNTWSYQRSSLPELLEAFVRPECVTDVTCDGCTKSNGSPSQSAFSKQLTIGKLPECLCMHIQRTVWLENGCAVKRKDFVTIPEVLNMEPFTYAVSINQQQKNLKGGLLGGREYIDKCKESASLESCISSSNVDSFLSSQYNEKRSERLRWKSNSLYKLQAVVVHVGDVISGHFVTYRRGAVDSTSSDRWYYTSDIVVKEVSVDEVLQSNAYMILYEKFTL